MNSRSAVQLITFGDSRILLLADLSGNAQKDLMKLLPEGALQAEIVKAPHHGENAMVTEFLDETAPALLLCTAGAADAPDLARQAAPRELPLLYSGEGAIVLDRLYPELVKSLAEYVAARADDPKKDKIVVLSAYTKKVLVKYGKLKVVTMEELAASCL